MGLLGIFGLLLILTGEVLSFFPVLPWAQHVFPIFWYGYILVLDSLNYQLRGTSLLFGRRREFLLMLLISAAYWYVFEWYNLAIEDLDRDHNENRFLRHSDPSNLRDRRSPGCNTADR
jgi:hypothetical protein